MLKDFHLSLETLRMVFIVIRVLNEEGGKKIEEETVLDEYKEVVTLRETMVLWINLEQVTFTYMF